MHERAFALACQSGYSSFGGAWANSFLVRRSTGLHNVFFNMLPSPPQCTLHTHQGGSSKQPTKSPLCQAGPVRSEVTSLNSALRLHWGSKGRRVDLDHSKAPEHGIQYCKTTELYINIWLGRGPKITCKIISVLKFELSINTLVSRASDGSEHVWGPRGSRTLVY